MSRNVLRLYTFNLSSFFLSARIAENGTMASDALTRLAAAKLFLQLPEDATRWSNGASAAMRNPKAFPFVDFGLDVEEVVEKLNYIFEGETWLSYRNFGKGDP